MTRNKWIFTDCFSVLSAFINYFFNNRRRIYSLATISLVFIVNYSFSQNNAESDERSRAIDTLNILLKTATHDTTRADLLVTLSGVLFLSNPDTVIPLCNKALTIIKKNDGKGNHQVKRVFQSIKANAFNNIGLVYKNQGKLEDAINYNLFSLKIREEIGYKKGIAESLNNIGRIYNNQGKIKEALDFYGRCLNIMETIGNKLGIAGALNNLGYIYNQQGQIKQALNYFSRSLKILEEIDDPQGIAVTLINLGSIYQSQGQLKEALGYYQRSAKIQEPLNDKQGLAFSYNNIGNIYHSQGQINVASEYYSKSLRIREEVGDRKGIANSLHNLGVIYQNKEQINDALNYFSRSLKIRKEINDKQGISSSLKSVGWIYLVQKKYLLAHLFADSSLTIAKAIGFPENIRNAEELFFKVDSARGNPAGALEHYKQFILYKDSIKNKETEKASIRQQTKYEFEKAQIVKEQEEKERSRQSAVAVSRRNKLQYSIILIVVVALMSSLLLLVNIKVNHKMAEGLIFLTFLIFFEFLLVLADPYMESFTGGAPGLKLLFNAMIAAGIFPVHAFFEGWLKKRLMKNIKVE